MFPEDERGESEPNPISHMGSLVKLTETIKLPILWRFGLEQRQDPLLRQIINHLIKHKTETKTIHETKYDNDNKESTDDKRNKTMIEEDILKRITSSYLLIGENDDDSILYKVYTTRSGEARQLWLHPKHFVSQSYSGITRPLWEDT